MNSVPFFGWIKGSTCVHYKQLGVLKVLLGF